MTVTEIAAEHGVSRVSIHTYRRRGTFPQPVEGEGTTRLRFREDEVAAFFAANPKQPGKRTDLPDKQQGEPVTVQDELTPAMALKDEVLQRLYRSYGAKDVHTMSAAQKLLAEYEAAVLLDAADALDESETLRDLTDDHMGDVNLVTTELRRMAAEKQQGEEA